MLCGCGQEMTKEIETESFILWKCKVKECGKEHTEWKELPPAFYDDIEFYIERKNWRK